jgi:hypothetical protein
MSGLKLNFTKSKIIMINGDAIREVQLAEFFNCQIGSFPIKYLGVTVSPCRLHVKDWKTLEEKREKKTCNMARRRHVHSWEGNSYQL